MRIIVTGVIGAGKSTVVRRVMDRLGWRQPAGFLTCWSDGRRPAPALILETWAGTSCVFAQWRKSSNNEDGPPYAADLSVLNHFAIEHMANVPAETPVVLDELGVLELGAETFTRAVAILFHRPGPILAVIQERALERWMEIIGPEKVEHVFRVEKANREALPDQIAALFAPGDLRP
ncbi:MAG: nucleoside-triphosphatase [Verrucomicrobia bacterium]|nr:nucleoside-triphosphatase [Verrucomicrobiota bacterium]